jgi:hypothetical protein
MPDDDEREGKGRRDAETRLEPNHRVVPVDLLGKIVRQEHEAADTEHHAAE